MIKQTTIRIDEELLKRMKIITIKNNTSINYLISEFFKKYLEENEN